MTIKGWKIWYSDSTFDSTQGPWQIAPDDDVQAIVVYYEEQIANTGEHYRDLLQGADHYSFDTKRFSLSEDDPESGLKGAHKGAVKHGRFVSDADYQAITNLALEDHGHGWLLPNRKATAKPRNTGMKAA